MRNYKPYQHPNLDSKGYQRKMDEAHRLSMRMITGYVHDKKHIAGIIRTEPLPVVPFPPHGIRTQAVDRTPTKRACPWCSLVECSCNFPYPTKGSYSRAQMDADLQGLDFMSAQISRLVARRLIGGWDAKIAYEKLDYMRRRCQMRLAFLAMVIGGRSQEKLMAGLRGATTPIPTDNFGRRRATSPKEG